MQIILYIIIIIIVPYYTASIMHILLYMHVAHADMASHMAHCTQSYKMSTIWSISSFHLSETQKDYYGHNIIQLLYCSHIHSITSHVQYILIMVTIRVMFVYWIFKLQYAYLHCCYSDILTLEGYPEWQWHIIIITASASCGGWGSWKGQPQVMRYMLLCLP